jgi:hypothetical protein
VNTARTFLPRSSSHALGDYVGRERRYIRLSDLEEFAPWETLEAQFAGLDTASLSERDKQAITAFRNAVARRRRGQPDPDGFREAETDE